MGKFSVNAPKRRVIRALELMKEQEHIAMIRINPDGTKIPLTIPNHLRIKSSTLRTICTQARIPRDEFIEAYEKTR